MSQGITALPSEEAFLRWPGTLASESLTSPLETSVVQTSPDMSSVQQSPVYTAMTSTF